MTENHIAQTLSKLFERHRVVFWYDHDQKFRGDFEALSLPNVETLEIKNNEFHIKYRLLREEPEKKFLLYHEGSPPDELDNWLLDVQLTHGEFRTDPVAEQLYELGLGPKFTEVVQAHEKFFQTTNRKDSLKKLLKPDDDRESLRLKMLAVCAGSEPRMDAVLEKLLQELAGGLGKKTQLIKDCKLNDFLWAQMTRHYGYKSDAPGIKDFYIELFKSCYAMGTDGQVKLTGDALVFLKRWKDSRQFERDFVTLSDKYAKNFDIKQDLEKRDFRKLIELDYFQFIDQKIISDLEQAVSSRTASKDEVAPWVRQRRQGHWYQEYRHDYQAINYAAQFFHALDEATLDMGSLKDGVERYSRSWYRIDQLYRKFTYHACESNRTSLLGTLRNQIERLYSNNFLLKLGDQFQGFVDEAAKWEAAPVRTQKEFFGHWVQPFLRKGIKVCVIISDAMRYEIGDELLSRIRQKDGYIAELRPALSMLPSYTQLGMAALLPNRELAIADNKTATVLVDGQNSQGIINRTKILGLISQRATAIKADELTNMKSTERRELVREHNVIYVYHNHIDATGDKKESEGRTFEAVEKTLEELIVLIKTLINANASHLLVTSDHGFIYQDQAIDESDFSENDAKGDQILFQSRRFVLGKGLKDVPALRKFTPAQLGLAGEVEVQIPKSINRLRLKGSGSRFVHGGASLQEVVIPVLKIQKKRKSDTTTVEVDIQRGGSSTISSGQLVVTLYQTEPVTDKVRPRTLRAGIYTKAGDLLSDSHNLTFDLSSDNSRERAQQVRFVLTHKADEANNQEVILKLEERHAKTSHFKEYKSLPYRMRRSFTSDFDL